MLMGRLGFVPMMGHDLLEAPEDGRESVLAARVFDPAGRQNNRTRCRREAGKAVRIPAG